MINTTKDKLTTNNKNAQVCATASFIKAILRKKSEGDGCNREERTREMTAGIQRKEEGRSLYAGPWIAAQPQRERKRIDACR